MCPKTLNYEAKWYNIYNDVQKGFPAIKTRFFVNDQIRASELRVIDAEGNFVGILSKQDAILKAKDLGLDLVEIAGNTNPAVAKIIDFGKYKYELTKKEQKAKKNQKITEIKMMRFSLKIEHNDLMIKLGKVAKFLLDGNKVRVAVRFRGRENNFPELGQKQYDKILANLAELTDSVITFDTPPVKAGNEFATTLYIKK